MQHDTKITLTQWNELSDEGKEQLRKWAIAKGYELDLVPGPSGSFDPVCDYAALLTSEQMAAFLHDQKQTFSEAEKGHVLWKQITKLLI